LAAGLYGKIAYIGLRWSEAFFSQNYFISAVSLNPILYFFDTYHYQVPEYDADEVRKYYPMMADYLGVPKNEQDAKTLNFKREVVNKPKTDFKPNVILIVMESLATAKTNLSPNPLDCTPYLKKLAGESYYFDQYYVPSQGTARSMFGIISSVADVTYYQTASRNPLLADQNVIMDYFDGYEKYYFLGGSANWAEIRSVFSNNVKDIHIVEEGDYTAPRTDVWGLSDLDLFKEAFKKLNNIPSNQPFFAVIQSASFHRPYTIPVNHDDFHVKTMDIDALKKAAFNSEEEWNSMRFSDYSLGAFIKLFKESPMYKNTILVVTGDHGLPDENAPHISLPRRVSEVEKYHVPFILHNPTLFPEAKVDSRLVSEPDAMPTLAGLAGISYTNTGLGRDMFDPQFDKLRMSFNFFHYIQPQPYGLLYDNFYYLVRGKSELFLNFNDPADERDVSQQYPEMFSQIKDMTQAYLQTAKYILYHNKNLRRPKELKSFAPTAQQ
jgi:phosphoglycerol transferase MdoB-like AlkP superfamily enzyme